MDSKTNKNYWDECWLQEPLPRPATLSDRSLRNHVRLSMHEYFVHAFSIANLRTQDAHLIEIGCGRSIWLPYFEKEFGFKVTGVDYSETGCTQARQMFKKQNMKSDAELICGDAFELAKDMSGKFDVVFSNGFIEHFTNTSEAITALAQYIKPGGFMISLIPNMSGTIGFFQRHMDREVYDTHVPLDARDLAATHKDSSLEVIESRYLMTLGYNVLNLSRLNSRSFPNLIKKGIAHILVAVSVMIWSLERLSGKQLPSRAFSPYISVIAKRPLEN